LLENKLLGKRDYLLTITFFGIIIVLSREDEAIIVVKPKAESQGKEPEAKRPGGKLKARKVKEEPETVKRREKPKLERHRKNRKLEGKREKPKAEKHR